MRYQKILEKLVPELLKARKTGEIWKIGCEKLMESTKKSKRYQIFKIFWYRSNPW
jgi:hypothetical protein